MPKKAQVILARITPFAAFGPVARFEKIQDFLEAHDAEGLVVARLREAAGDQGVGRLEGSPSRSRNGSPLRTAGDGNAS